MIARNSRATVRETAKVPAVYRPHTIPAPTLGIIANANLSAPQPGSALVLENILPTAESAILRRGSQGHAIIGIEGSPVTALFTYANGNNRILFVANEEGIYNVTTPPGTDNLFLVTDDGDFIVNEDDDILFISSSPDPAIDSMSGGNWSVVQFGTPDGVYLRAVNGANTPLVFDGTDWSDTPAVTSLDGDFVATTLSYVWAHQGRLWFVEKDTLSAWYLPAAQIGGEAAKFPLDGVFNLGGSLLFGATWSLETGGGGLSEQCVFVTTEGEVAVYRGSDPNDADTWQKVGIYKIGKPLGPDAHFRAGGDLVIATDIGLIALSSALQKDFAVLSQNAVSSQIDTIWNKEVRERGDGYWHCQIWSKNQYAVIVPPRLSGQQPVIYVVHTRTGAWGKITGWDATCIAVFNDRLFFGTPTGNVIEGNVTGLDGTVPYTGIYIPAFSDFGFPGTKTTGLTRTTIRAAADVNDVQTMQREYLVSLPAAPSAPVISGGNVWGEAVWGEARWGEAADKQVFQVWRSTPANGAALAPAIQITSGSATPLDAEIIKTEVTYIPDGVIA